MPRAKKTETVTELGTWGDDADDDNSMLQVKGGGHIWKARKPTKEEPADPATKSEVTQLVETEITRDQERWRQAAADAASTGVMPPNAVIHRLGVAFNLDAYESQTSFADDVRAIKSHRSAIAQAEGNLKHRQKFFKDHGDVKTLKAQLKELQESAKELAALLNQYHRWEASGSQWVAPKIEANHRRIWPLSTNPCKN